MTELTLVSHHLCPYFQRAAIALDEKGVPYERVYVDLSAKPDWFVALSPLGKVPLLKIRQAGSAEPVVLFESAVILEYLEDTQVNPLHPDDPLERAHHRAWIEFGSAILNAIAGFYSASSVDEFERATERLKALYQRLEDALGDGPWFAGDRFSLVDAVYAPVFRYFDTFDTIADFRILADKPKIRSWRLELAARSSVRNAVAADYPIRLEQFLIRRGGILAQRMPEAA